MKTGDLGSRNEKGRCIWGNAVTGKVGVRKEMLKTESPNYFITSSVNLV